MFRHSARAFTLVELITVMALLAVIAAVAAPRLSGFLAGRNVDEECRRFVALTQFAGEEAISRGERAELWLEPDTGTYGVRVDHEDVISFTCQDKLTFTVNENDLDDGIAIILFWPDGTVDVTSPELIELTESGVPVYEIALDRNALRYAATAVMYEN